MRIKGRNLKIRPLSKPHLLAKMTIFATSKNRFFSHVAPHCLQNRFSDVPKTRHFFKQSEFRKRSIRKKFPLTVIEVVIGALLLTMIVGMLFNSLGHSLRFSRQLEGAKKEVLARSYLQERLTEVFSTLLPPEDKKESTFYTGEIPEKQELFFRFNNGIDPDLNLCDEVTGHLFLRQGNLYLTLEGKEKVKKEEILMRSVRSISFDFYDESKGKADKAPLWDSQKNKHPHFFVLHINKQEEEEQNLIFPFYIQNEKDGISIY